MNEINLEPKKLKVTREGKEYFVRYPSVREMKDYQKKVKETDPSETFDVLEKYLQILGLEPELTEQLDADGYIELLNILHGSKKN